MANPMMARGSDSPIILEMNELLCGLAMWSEVVLLFVSVVCTKLIHRQHGQTEL